MKTKYMILAVSVLAASLLNISCASAENCSASASKGKKDIGLQLYSLRADIKKDYDNTIKKAGEMGYTSVEAAGYGNGKFYGKTPEEFKKSVEDAGMKVLSSHMNRPLTKEELQTKDFSKALAWWDEAIAAHKAAGMKYMVMPYLKRPDTMKDLQTYCEYFNEVGKRAAAAGISFGYHNHAHEFEKVEGKAVMLNYMLENTDPKYVFFELDVYWAVRGQVSPVELFQKYPGRFRLLHIKDHKELGQSGMVGFDAIFNNIKTAGAENIIVEVERYNYTPFESVKRSYDYLNNADFVK